MRSRLLAALFAVLLASRCVSAIHEPAQLPAPAPSATDSAPEPAAPSATVMIQRAEQKYALRPDAAAVREAEQLFLAAAATDTAAIEPLIGAIRAKAWLSERETDAARREQLAVSAVDAALWCTRREPDSPRCDYWLAIALGIQAREKPTTGKDGIEKMVEHLNRAIENDPSIDHAGPHRVLALVYLRAPGWPAGPGDPEAGLTEAQAAVKLDPEFPPNRLALLEALLKNHRTVDSEIERSSLLAQLRTWPAQDPDLGEWAKDLAALK